MGPTGSQPAASPAAPVRRLTLAVPEDVSANGYFSGLLASALVASVGALTLFLTGVLFARTSGRAMPRARFTRSGLIFIHPEHETVFFLGACFLAVVLVLAQTMVWNRRLRSSAAPPRAAAYGWLAVGGGGTGALTGALLAFFIGRGYVLRNVSIPGATLVALLVVAAGCLVLGAVGARARFSWQPRPATSADAGEPPLDRRHLSVWDGLVPLFVISVLVVPAWRLLAGRAYQDDALIHWDYFAMGPTTAFIHGAALGTQVRAQYGIGWPVLFGLLRPLLSVSYGHMILIGSVTSAVYFVGVYLLLRLTTGQPTWAAAGTLLALLLQVFNGNFVALTTTVLHFPSISVLRRPLDVWVFLALVLHHRTKRRVWAVAAGALTGLALVFSTDTGLYLAAALLLYWGCDAVMGGRRELRWAAASIGAALAAFLTVVAIGSRGTLFSVSFWKAWYEPIGQGAAGYTALPLVGRADIWGVQLPSRPVLAYFVVIAVLYLTVLCHLVIKAAHRRATATEVTLGCISVYGLLSLTSFVGRSDPLELPHLLVPFAVVATVLAARGYGRLVTRTQREATHTSTSSTPRIALALVPLLLVAVLAITVGVNPSFRDYPGLLQSIFNPPPGGGSCLLTAPRDVCGLPAILTPQVRLFAAETEDMRRLATGGRVALIDYSGTYPVQADIAPWGQYTPLLPALFEQSQLRTALAQLLEQRPTWVFIRPVAADPAYVADSAAAFLALLKSHYTLDHIVGTFEVFKIRPSGP